MTYIIITIAAWLTATAINAAINRRNAARQKQAQRGINMAAAGTMLAVLILMALDARAESRWLPYTEVFFGVDATTIYPAPQCTDDRIVSNLGVEQGIWQNGHTSVFLKYQHHSCAFGFDTRLYDGYGLGVKYRIDWGGYTGGNR